jgi:threonine 3-dehydrogenase
MGKPVALVTGAGGEMGRVLLPALEAQGFAVVALDLRSLPPELRAHCVETVELDILDAAALQSLLRRHRPAWILHLAAVLSSHAEQDPERAHQVNVAGTLELLAACRRLEGGTVRFLFPSSIAVYGLPDAAVKAEQGALKEWQWTTPTGIYGCGKLYCELVGTYWARRTPPPGGATLDFRAIRFPGLISADTLPTGGTTDFAPEMIHAAAQFKPYSCFVSEGSRLPFMTMPDAVEALLQLGRTDASRLSTRVYNIKGFSCTAGQIRLEVLKYFPRARIAFEPLPGKQAIVDSWPADVDDSAARRDWNLSPRHGLTEAFRDYLVPALEKRYAAREPVHNPTRPGS